MRNIKLLCVIIGTTLIMTGCELFTGFLTTPGRSKNYVQIYVITDSLHIEKSEISNIIWITCKGDTISNKHVDEIAKKYGDTHYNKGIIPWTNFSTDNVFTKIDIVSDADFNSYPAGTSLAAITQMLAASPYPYVSRGYKGNYDWRNIPEGWEKYFVNSSISLREGYSPINDKASNLSEKELVIIHPSFIYMRFLETPEIKTHTFTVTFYEGEKEYKGKLTMTFDENQP